MTDKCPDSLTKEVLQQLEAKYPKTGFIETCGIKIPVIFDPINYGVLVIDSQKDKNDIK